jgi:deoxyribonuclease V
MPEQAGALRRTRADSQRNPPLPDPGDNLIPRRKSEQPVYGIGFEGNRAGHAEEVAMRPALGKKLDPAETAFFGDLQGLLSKEKASFPRNLSRICAVDAAYDGDSVVTVASLFDHGLLKEVSFYSGTCSLPYQSGLFYLREGPFVVQAVRGLRVRPQIVCFDAHGAAHPRFMGMATVAGMVLGIPSVGIAKSLQVGAPVRAEGSERVVYGGRTVGFVTRMDGSRRYWSPGYSVDLRELASLIRNHAQTCLSAMSHSHRTATEHLRRSSIGESPQLHRRTQNDASVEGRVFLGPGGLAF